MPHFNKRQLVEKKQSLFFKKGYLVLYFAEFHNFVYIFADRTIKNSEFEFAVFTAFSYLRFRPIELFEVNEYSEQIIIK